MNGGKRSETDRPRRLSDDEHELWTGVTRSIKPLRRPPRPGRPSNEERFSEPISNRDSPPDMSDAKRGRASARQAPPLAPLSRRIKQKLARGTEAIDRRIDLHGLTQAEALGALKRFLWDAQNDGARFVLIITGKGRSGTGGDWEGGVLRREVPRWLKLKEFRDYVIGFEPAHSRHGGEGAIYVRLRRLRKD
jgi:DNA-nicking Smr family endonuclease